MARVTVEDCMPFVESRFELVMVAAQRAREAAYSVPRNDDKNTVVALREIEEQAVAVEDLREQVIKNLQSFVKQEERADYDDSTDDSAYDDTVGLDNHTSIEGMPSMIFEDVDVKD